MAAEAFWAIKSISKQNNISGIPSGSTGIHAHKSLPLVLWKMLRFRGPQPLQWNFFQGEASTSPAGSTLFPGFTWSERTLLHPNMHVLIYGFFFVVCFFKETNLQQFSFLLDHLWENQDQDSVFVLQLNNRLIVALQSNQCYFAFDINSEPN